MQMQCNATSSQLNSEDRLRFTKHQPSVAAWFDQGNHDIVWEQALGYVGTKNIVSHPGAYYLSPNFGGEHVLLRRHDGEIVLRENLCTHRQARLLTNEYGVLNRHATHGSLIQCPLHKWAFNEKGDVVGNPGRGFHDCNVLGSLKSASLTDWRGMLFSRPAALGRLNGFGRGDSFDAGLFEMSRFHEMVEVRHYETDYNPLIFDWNYLDCYHVAPAHPKTFGEVADPSTLKWEFGDGYCVQVVHGSPVDTIPERSDISWARLANKMYSAFPEAAEQPFALWAHMYPGLMPELYFGGHLLAVSYLVPVSPMACDNVVEYYISKAAYAAFGDGLMDEFIKTYRTSADEDDDLCREIQKGWLRIAKRQDSGIRGPFHDPLEDGMVHYLKWLADVGFSFSK